MKYHVIIDGLKLPRFNEVLRWPKVTRHTWDGKRYQYCPKEQEVAKDSRKRFEDAARYGHGLVDPTPLSKAHVDIQAYGPYARHDPDALIAKWVLDAIVARPIRFNGKAVNRRMGLILDDSPKVIGNLEFGPPVLADKFKVEITVYEV